METPTTALVPCRHCKSKFAAEDLGRHEADCGKVGAGQRGVSGQGDRQKGGRKPPRRISCRRCRAAGKMIEFSSISQLMGHVRETHAEDFRRKHSEGIRRRQAGLRKADAAMKGKPSGGKVTSPTRSPTRARGIEEAPPPRCPLCGGNLPASTAQLLAELRSAGFAEPSAFEAVKIAMRVFGPGGAR